MMATHPTSRTHGHTWHMDMDMDMDMEVMGFVCVR